MTTHITLQDGRILGTSNWAFDALLECAAKELERRKDTVGGLPEWLLDQRCIVRGPGIGYLDLRELCFLSVYVCLQICVRRRDEA